MTSLVDLLRDGERNKVGVKGDVILVTPKGLSEEKTKWAKDYLSRLDLEAIARHLKANGEWIKISKIKEILYTEDNPEYWGILIGNRLRPFSSCGYKPSAERQKQAHSVASQAL